MQSNSPMNENPTANTLPIRWGEFETASVVTASERPTASCCREMLNLRIELGRTTLNVGETEKLRAGAIMPLDNAASEPADIYADGRLIARGEVLTVDGKYGVRVVELVS